MKNYTRLFLAITMFLGVVAFSVPFVVSAEGSPSGLFNFISPSSGERIVAGKTYNIQWNGPIEWIMSPGVTESIKNVKLTVSCGNPSLGATNDTVIVKSTKNDGLYKWSVPKKIGSSDYCRIIIEDKKGEYYDVSPVFGIGETATFLLVSATSTYSYNATTPSLSYTTGVITLKVHSDGGTTTKPTAEDFTVNAYNNGNIIGAVDSKAVTVTPDTNIPDGSDATITINLSETRASSGTGFINFGVAGINWAVGSSSASQTWGLDTFKTPAVFAF